MSTFEKLSKDELVRDYQLRILTVLASVKSYVLNVPDFVDLIRIERGLIDIYRFILEDFDNSIS